MAIILDTPLKFLDWAIWNYKEAQIIYGRYKKLPFDIHFHDDTRLDLMDQWCKNHCSNEHEIRSAIKFDRGIFQQYNLFVRFNSPEDAVAFKLWF